MYKDYPDRTQQLASVFTFSVNYFECCSISQYESYHSSCQYPPKWCLKLSNCSRSFPCPYILVLDF